MTIDAGAEKETARAEARREEREHGAGCRRGRAEDQTELAKPGDLVDERARAREKEERPERRNGAHPRFRRHARLDFRLLSEHLRAL